MGRVQDKVVMITGAGSGAGRADALLLAKEGAKIIATDANFETAKATAAEIGGDAIALPLNITREEDWVAAFAAAKEKFGHVDVLVNNAGLGGSAPLAEMTDEQWNVVLDVTLTGTFRMMRAMLPHMMARKSGIMVNNASVLGWRAQKLQAHYAAAKAGVMALTRCAAVEAAEHNIRINAVSPSLAMHEFLNRVTSDELLAQLTSREAYGRAAETWEIANVIIFLASDYATYMTGEVVAVSSQRA